LKPLAAISQQALREIKGVFTDIDDTLTSDGSLTAAAYGALERLHESALLVMPITGRSAGWCDHIARMWPVDGVVGENGAFYFRYHRESRRMERYFLDSADERAARRARLGRLGESILEAVPGAAVAADQAYRETDLAIDFCEDVAPLPEREVQRIVELFEVAGATAKVSSIHVNGWFGSYDKLTMTRTMMGQSFGLDLDREKENFVFSGDSPNDAPMFAFFPLAVGMANVLDFSSQLESEPAFVTQGRAGVGFVELADRLLGKG
jgi:hypothetical protein